MREIKKWKSVMDSTNAEHRKNRNEVPTASENRLTVVPSTNGRVLLSKWRYPVAAVNLRLSEIKIRSSKPHLWPHI